jgi:hypothetical protein
MLKNSEKIANQKTVEIFEPKSNQPRTKSPAKPYWALRSTKVQNEPDRTNALVGSHPHL